MSIQGSMRDKTAKKITVSIDGMNIEPWIKLEDAADLEQWSRLDEIVYNQVSRQTEKALFFRRVFDYLKCNEIYGDFHEYGCHRCRTFRMVLTEAKRQNLNKMDFFAFDSFEGLPEPESPNQKESWYSGALKTRENDFLKTVQDHGLYTDKITTFKGYYDQILTDTLKKNFIRKEKKIALVNVDCDLYESAVPVFNFIEPLLQEGSIIYIDDLFVGYKGIPSKGVGRAFLEFQKISKWKFFHHLSVGWWGRSYIVYSKEYSQEGVL